ncbi:SRPBCC domain-containing protein [Streptomyces sp. HUAS ZL42]|uniref:SRPBCC domain-containing protein n=1 Tax=Streptomyces sp. HUAS ZL42 TaxID=3231715 RepID=UPI00345E5804
MEHEVFVPVPAEQLRAALADPAQVARAVPGLQQDAGTEPVAGRLKVRVGSHSITYRGSVRISARDDGTYAVEGDATEARGTGSVKLALTLRVRDAEGGSVLTFDGSASVDGRATEFPQEALGSAVQRLLTRFAENLGAGAEAVEAEAPESPELPGPPETPESLGTEDFEPSASAEFGAAPDADDAPVPPSVHPPASEDFAESAEPPAEAAHARRTMIGRSAEEVDHAPPRGRYAPVPAPQTVAPSTALRWAVPVAALAVASAVVVGRALRRRR